jgi:DNA-binding protein HU-beta
VAKITLNEFSQKIAEARGLKKSETKDFIEAILSTIVRATAAGDKIVFPGFGSFSLRTAAARKRMNPRTGETVDVPEKQVLKFRASKKVS